MGEGHGEFRRHRIRREDAEGIVLMLLLEQPLTIDEMAQKARFLASHRRVSETDPESLGLDAAVTSLCSKGLAEEADGRYRLTEAGRSRAVRAEAWMARIGEYLSSGAAAAKLSMAVTAFLSVLKLAAGLLANSVGLISDGLDNLMDVVSSGVVYLGIKRKRELYATIFIIVLMFIVAAGILLNSVTRLVHPQGVEAGLFPIAAAVVSGVSSYLLYGYQRFVGRRSGNTSLVSESVDSMNHVVVAVAVLVGIFAAMLGTPIVDALVGLFVAAFILRGSITLAVDTARARGGEMDLAHYGSGWERMLNEARRRRIKSWLLFRLDRPVSIEELGVECERAFSTSGLAVMHQTGLDMFAGVDFGADGKSVCDEMVNSGLLRLEGGGYVRTEAGKAELEKELRARRGGPRARVAVR